MEIAINRIGSSGRAASSRTPEAVFGRKTAKRSGKTKASLSATSVVQSTNKAPNAVSSNLSTSAQGLEPGEQVALMDRIAGSGDRTAFAALFEYFAPRIKAYLMRGGTDPVSAEELAQEAMLMVWRKADRFDASQASVATWIFTIARNKRIDAFRRANRPELEADDPLLQPTPEPMQDDTVQDQQTATAIQEAMKDLPEEQVIMLKLAFFEDKAHSEIAEVTGLPLGTVKSRLRLAMGKLRAALGGHEL